MTRRMVLHLIAAPLVIAERTALATSSQGVRPEAARYIDALDRYRRGDYDTAVRTLVAFDPDELNEGRNGLLNDVGGEAKIALLRVAAVAHADAAIAIRPFATALEARRQLTLGQMSIERVQAQRRVDPIAARWWLLAIGYLHAQRDFRAAIPVIERARGLNGDTPELLLAFGITHELWWSSFSVHVAGASPSANLAEAEKAYRRVLTADRSALEARVRLARVRIMRDDPDEAARILDGVTDGDVRLLYLARLFRGNAQERKGSLSDAQRSYEAAAALIPLAQSAQIALAHARYGQGARTEAAEIMRASAANQTASEDADPWFWYTVGYASRIDGDLADLRRMIR
jgi:tetratricopeptide (TPR) repeat protein